MLNIRFPLLLPSRGAIGLLLVVPLMVGIFLSVDAKRRSFLEWVHLRFRNLCWSGMYYFPLLQNIFPCLHVLELPSNNCALGFGKLFMLFNTSSIVPQSLGVLAEAQYFQNVMRTGFRLRSTLVSVI
jgi:hypothetical protein